VRVSWHTDTDLVRRLLLEVATEHANVLSKLAPEVELLDIRNGLHFVLQVWSIQYLQGEARLESELNFAIRQKLRSHGIEAPARGDRDPIATPR
jgi:small-conductance mechanosensitive channel